MLLLFNIGQLRQDSDMLHFFFSDCINNIPCTRVKKSTIVVNSSHPNQAFAADRTLERSQNNLFPSHRQTVDHVLEFKVFLVLEDCGGLHFDFAKPNSDFYSKIIHRQTLVKSSVNNWSYMLITFIMANSMGTLIS